MRHEPPSLPAIDAVGFYTELDMWEDDAEARGAFQELQILHEIREIAEDMQVEPEDLM